MKHTLILLLLSGLLAVAAPREATAAEILCDTGVQDCRARLLDLIRNENAGIDVAFWFMEDARYTNEIIKRFQAGVPVRVLVDTRANSPNPLNAERLAELQRAGIPMRRRTASGILHWKMMLFSGQNTVQFSAANYSPEAFVPNIPYVDYIDEVIYYTDDTSVVNSFRTKYDDLWTNTTKYANYANVGTLTRSYGTFTKDPELNFPSEESYRSRAVRAIDAESSAIDAIIYRITDRAYSDAMIRAVQRGVPARLITEPRQYRDPVRMWHSWNVDRMYMAGVQIRDRAHAGLIHQKSFLVRAQAMTVFGSSNWTSPSSDSQQEHNYFTKKAAFFQFFSDQFDRKWNNTTGNAETKPFVPLPPDKPVYVSPADAATGQPTTSVTLTWNAGLWAHLYDIYLGTTADPPLLIADQELGPSQSATSNKTFAVTNLAPGTTYYWRIVSKTMAQKGASGPIYSFTTAGQAGPPPPSSTLGPGDVLLYASKAPVVRGAWRVVSDASAAGGSRLHNPDAGAAKLTPAQAAPADYFELTFTAQAGKPYHLWIRGQAQGNYYGNDSAHVQFSGAVNASGTPIARIGTTTSLEVSVQDGNGAVISGWGWQDNGWGSLGPHLYFATSGTQTIRIQRREDGLSIDQILLSPEKFLTGAPGAPRNDATILPEANGGGSPPPPPPPSGAAEQVLYAADATIVGTEWVIEPQASAAAGTQVRIPDAGRAKVVTASAAPASYVELTFQAEANTPYRLWIRGRADSDYWANDSVHVQFSDSVTSSGSAAWRIGTTGSAEVNLEDCGGCGVAGWGWQDNGWGTGVLGPQIYFATAGTHTLRIQRREDGFAIDQVVLSPSAYLNRAPGSLKNDATILPKSGS